MRHRAAHLALAIALPAHAASFNCKAAQTPREKAICSTPELSGLDDQLARAYAAVRSRLTPSSAALVQSDQREWLAWLDKVCPPNNPAIDTVASCLTENYNGRLGQLTAGITRVDGTLFYTRAHFVFAPGKPPAKDDASNNPGFGYGEFSWPQVDAPDRDHAAFNTAVAAAARKLEGSTPKGKAPSFDAAVDNSGSLDGDFILSAVNQHLIAIDFSNSTYGWGAAHPLTGENTFLWSLDLQRALTADDILRPDTNWQTGLIKPTIAKLQDNSSSVWKGEELRKAVSDGIKDVSAWDPSAKGLTITFGQYAVAPYSEGMPSVTFTWRELAPYLNPTFNPKDLPTSLLPAS